MFKTIDSPYLVGEHASFEVSESPTRPPKGAPGRKALKKQLVSLRKELGDLQHRLFAEDRRSLLLVFQAMDAAGKDSTIRAVMKQVNPAGCQVFSFKKPSARELDHDFLWRSNIAMPERGRIGIFNRSYYEETLVVRVHPEYLLGQRLPPQPAAGEELWQQRFESIRGLEQHMARNGTVVLKFWLNVSREEQRRRFLSRLDTPEKYWKFSSADIKERELWDDYMFAYQESISATSRPWAPWYAIPADDKPFMRATVAKIVVDTLQRMAPEFPQVDAREREMFDDMRALLEKQKKLQGSESN